MQEITSAGGIVFDIQNGAVVILLCQPSGKDRWVFPKGKVGDKVVENSEQAALREVREETGATAEIVGALEPVILWYTKKEGGRVRKTVYYFLMKYLSGDITQHDWEMQNVVWVPLHEVAHRLTHAGDKKLWMKARERLELYLQR